MVDMSNHNTAKHEYNKPSKHTMFAQTKWQVNKAIFLYDGTNDLDLAISSSDVMSALSNLINTDRVTLVWFLSSGKYRFMPLEWVQIVVLKTNPQEVHVFAARMCVDVVFSVVVVVMTLRW